MVVQSRWLRHAGPMWPSFIGFVLVLSSGIAAAGPKPALVGSAASLRRQVATAEQNDFTPLETAVDVRRFVGLGLLVPVEADADLRLHGVSFPFARPEVRTFVERLAPQYRKACGERLVVTSLTRPASHQPPNAYRASVHRTGMAVDLRRSARPSCTRWLEQTLVTLEAGGVLEATLERRPPHYHVAVFPRRYARYVAASAHAGDSTNRDEYEVRPGDTLWVIARRYDVTVDAVVKANRLKGSKIIVGQKLRIPRES